MMPCWLQNFEKQFTAETCLLQELADLEAAISSTDTPSGQLSKPKSLWVKFEYLR
jgi:hypothetical protein